MSYPQAVGNYKAVASTVANDLQAYLDFGSEISARTREVIQRAIDDLDAAKAEAASLIENDV